MSRALSSRGCASASPGRRERASALLAAIARRARPNSASGEMVAVPTQAFRPLLDTVGDFLQPTVLGREQSNTSVAFGDLFILKLIRRLEEGINPDFDVGRFLTERTDFRNVVPIASALELRHGRSAPTTLAVLHSYLPNRGDAWSLTLDTLARYFEDVIGRADSPPRPVSGEPVGAAAREAVPAIAAELLGLYLEQMRLLGTRTAELHLALGSDPDDPEFRPEPL